jgi:hypothetical protein
MRAQRRLALLAAAGMLVAAAGVLLAPGVAGANPGNDDRDQGRPGYHAPGGNGSGYGHGSGNHYPAPPASVTVSSGTVRAGKSVRVSGNGFGRREPVVVQTRYRPSTRYWFPRQGIVIGQQTVWTNNHGRFSTHVQTWLQGTITITARGLRSGKSGSASVNVLPRQSRSHGSGGGWWAGGESGSGPAVETRTVA